MSKLLQINDTGDMSVIDSSILTEENDIFTASVEMTAAKLVFKDPTNGEVKLADRELGLPANGFILDNVAVDGTVKVWRISQLITGLTNLNVGKQYYLGTAGAVVDAAPAFGTGFLMQKIGKAASTSTLPFTPESAVAY
jgi:hypothetical protein